MATQQHPASSTSEIWTIHDSNLALFDCLSQSIGKRPALPPEMIMLILTDPSRWILLNSESFELASSPSRPGQARVIHWQGTDREPILSTRVLLQRDAIAAVGAIFTFRSQDQGWSSDNRMHHGTYDHSWTWMEASIIRDTDVELSEKRWELQRNRHAGREAENYRIELEKDHEMLTFLREGDKIALWARALYPGWRNFVHEAKIELRFAGVDDLQEV